MFSYRIEQVTKKNAFGGVYRCITLECQNTGAWTLISAIEADDMLTLVKDGEFDAANETAQDILIADHCLVLDVDGVWKSDEAARDDRRERFAMFEHYRIERARIHGR